ncbi:hypothetical protein GCM10010260_66960 [Streptomyces filipinensis]|uniref:Uncharacterized protein n=1 Tax=Streptomyces filipinensis TaxID=66887 RepID=A0A918IHC4_9ACTN|nr:hypothetical protein GCM10010260_66960 [Streptomyces filipinensis]
MPREVRAARLPYDLPAGPHPGDHRGFGAAPVRGQSLDVDGEFVHAGRREGRVPGDLDRRVDQAQQGQWEGPVAHQPHGQREAEDVRIGHREGVVAGGETADALVGGQPGQVEPHSGQHQTGAREAGLGGRAFEGGAQDALGQQRGQRGGGGQGDGGHHAPGGLWPAVRPVKRGWWSAMSCPHCLL